MSRIFGHRVVLRDPYHRIISDKNFESFAFASPIYEADKATVPAGHTLSLQDGARIIFTYPEGPQVLMSVDHLKWFRDRVQTRTGKISQDAVYFHGWQRRMPILHDRSPLFLTSEEQVAVQYSRWGLPSGTNCGVAKYRFRCAYATVYATLGPFSFVKEFEELTHEDYAFLLRRWAEIDSVDVVADHNEVISIRPYSQLSVIDG